MNKFRAASCAMIGLVWLNVDAPSWGQVEKLEASSLVGHKHMVTRVATMGDRIASTAANEGTVLIWSLPSGKLQLKLKGPQERPAKRLIFADSNTLIAVHANQTDIWSLNENQISKSLEDAETRNIIAYSTRSRLSAHLHGDTVRVRAMLGNASAQVHQIKNGVPRELAVFSADEKELSVLLSIPQEGAAQFAIETINLANGKAARSKSFHSNYEPSSMLALKDGVVVAARNGMTWEWIPLKLVIRSRLFGEAGLSEVQISDDKRFYLYATQGEGAQGGELILLDSETNKRKAVKCSNPIWTASVNWQHHIAVVSFGDVFGSKSTANVVDPQIVPLPNK